MNAEVEIVEELSPGDIGWLVHLHGWLYAKECGYDRNLELYVARGICDALLGERGSGCRFWLAKASGAVVGAIAIVEHSDERAQLRWFLVHPDHRRGGLGKELFTRALAHCRAKKYAEVFLDTTEDQTAAKRMYEAAGFAIVSEHASDAWGKKLVEQRYRLLLAPR